MKNDSFKNIFIALNNVLCLPNIIKCEINNTIMDSLI